ncbi:MAG: hypothetical protein KGQ82_06840 [Alphaproteobacteria bacterium]|nr:hypothetical protein [Alphaproteobacteria bacterium]
MRITRRLLLVLALALAGCIAQNPTLPVFATAEHGLLPPAPGMARLFFYRLLEPSEPALGTTVMLNEKPVGFSRNGTVLYRDVPAGSYFVSVVSRGPYPYQFKTVQVAAGQTWYFRIESLASWSCSGKPTCRGDTFVVAIVDPAQARAEIAPLGLLGG